MTPWLDRPSSAPPTYSQRCSVPVPPRATERDRLLMEWEAEHGRRPTARWRLDSNPRLETEETA